MIPSILEGDRIVVDKLAYDLRVPFTFIRLARFSDPERSDIITFDSPMDGKLLVKRVIGIPGDTVELKHNRLFVNGEAATYQPLDATAVPRDLRAVMPFIDVYTETVAGQERTVMVHRRRPPQIQDSFAAVEVPADHYLVLGDNRDRSKDYRYIKFVHRDLVLGRANAIAFSLDYENYYMPRADRFFQDLD